MTTRAKFKVRRLKRQDEAATRNAARAKLGDAGQLAKLEAERPSGARREKERLRGE